MKVKQNPSSLLTAFTRKKLVIITTVLVLSQLAPLRAEEGKDIFRRTCATCHTVGDGRLVGPDLANVHNRRDEAWILKFVTSSSTLIKSGDEQAKAIFAEYNKIPMPDQPLSEAEILQVIEYIKENSPEMADGSTEVADAAPAEPEVALVGDVLAGQESFVGIQRFANGGPACNSCHNVNYDAIMTGGLLAKDLTEAYTRLTGAGIAAILKNPGGAFPKMGQAFEGKELTEEEIANLTAFLKEADEQRIYQHSRDYGLYFKWAGIPGALTLMLVFYLLWIKRKSHTVNKDIYDRQMKS